LDDLPVGMIKKFELGLYKFIDAKFPGIQAEIELKNDLDLVLKSKLDNLIADFKKEFLAKDVTIH